MLTINAGGAIMAAQRQTRKEVGSKESTGGAQAVANPEVIEQGKKVKENIDKILDEIDEVLEENAEEFVKNYVQKGGE